MPSDEGVDWIGFRIPVYDSVRNPCVSRKAGPSAADHDNVP